MLHRARERIASRHIPPQPAEAGFVEQDLSDEVEIAGEESEDEEMEVDKANDQENNVRDVEIRHDELNPLTAVHDPDEGNIMSDDKKVLPMISSWSTTSPAPAPAIITQIKTPVDQLLQRYRPENYKGHQDDHFETDHC